MAYLSVFARILLGAVVGLGGAAIFIALGLPLPWFLGALAGTFVAAVAGLPIRAPTEIANPVRAVLGVAVGAAFNPDVLARAGSMVPSLALILPWVAIIVGLGTLLFTRVFKIDTVTAVFASVPGGLTDMVTMAEDAKANTRTVTLIQLSRIALLVFMLPLYLQWHDGYKVSGLAFAAKSHLTDLTPRTLAELVVLGTVGYYLARFLKIAGPGIIGPMLLSGAAHASGLTAVKVPFEAMVFAQVCLGILLGAQFRGLTRTEFRTTFLAGLTFSVLILILLPVIATVVEHISGFHGARVIMAYAPGGQAELNLLALSLNLDIAFIALHHLVRLAAVMLLAQIIARRVMRRS